MSDNKASERRKRHRDFIKFWHDNCIKIRGVKPIITGKDAKNLRRVLDIGVIENEQLEQLAVYFLSHPSFRLFSPTLSVFLSAGVLNGLMNRLKNDNNFWKELNILVDKYVGIKAEENNEILNKLFELKKRLFENEKKNI